MKWKAFQNRPLLHFAVLGSLLFGASEQLAPQTRPDGEPQRIRLEAATIARMVDQFERRSREKASPSVRSICFHQATVSSWRPLLAGGPKLALEHRKPRGLKCWHGLM